DLDARLDLSGEYPALYADAQIRNLDLHAMHFMADSFRLAGDLALGFDELNPDYPNGQLVWANPYLHTKGQAIRLDSIYLVSRPDVDSGQQIELNLSNMLYTRLSGHMPLTQAGRALLAHVNRHYRLGDSLHQGQPAGFAGVRDSLVDEQQVHDPGAY